MKFFLATTLISLTVLLFAIQEIRRLKIELNEYSNLKLLKEALAENKKIDGNCLDQSKRLLEIFEKKGIKGNISLGETQTSKDIKGVCHAWVAVWIEPQTNQLISDYFLTNNCK